MGGRQFSARRRIGQTHSRTPLRILRHSLWTRASSTFIQSLSPSGNPQVCREVHLELREVVR